MDSYDQISTLEFTQDTDDVNLSFWRKVSSELYYDYLHFYLDGVERGSWSGEEGWEQFTYPIMAGSHTFGWTYEKDGSVSEGSDAAWIDDIAFLPLSPSDLDFGDADAPYPTTLAEDGARHTPAGPRLGPYRDWESDGTHSVGADADDHLEGVTLEPLVASAAVSRVGSLEIDLQNADATANYLDGWIDFNGDGDWDDLGEQIFTSHNLGTSSGTQTVTFTIPQDTGDNISCGDTYARFRLSTTGGLLPTGLAIDGEVEDYRVSVTWFEPPQVLNSHAPWDTAWHYSPDIATDGAGNWVAAWYSSDSLGGTIGTDRDILVARSTDDGGTWTKPASLNTNAAYDSGDDQVPRVTTDGAGNWVAAWSSFDSLGGTIGGDLDILVARSADSGATWTTPVPLNTNAGADAGRDNTPEISTDGVGNWVAVWDSWDSLGDTIGTDADILVARSADAGATWTDPQPLNAHAGSDSGGDEAPRLATDGAGNWVAVWESHEDLGGMIGTDSDILVARSTDVGNTWTNPAPLNTYAESDSGADQYPTVTTDGADNWVAVWESGEDLGGTTGIDLDIFVASSTDAGNTWTVAAPLNTNAGADSGFDCYPNVTTDAAGNWVAVWRSSDTLGGTLDTDHDILVSHSADAGGTWTAPAPLNTNAGSDSGDDSAPRIAADRAGNWVAVWKSYASLGSSIRATETDVVTARYTDAAGTWSEPVPLNTNAGVRAGGDLGAQVTTDGLGNWVAVWLSSDSLGGTVGTDRDIFVARSTDACNTWTASAPLNTNAGSDSEDDSSPQVTTDGVGNWVAVWDSEDSLGGTIGDDGDILVARSIDAGVTWTVPAPLNGNAGADSGDDYYPQIATDRAGSWVAVWSSYNNLDGTSDSVTDILVSRSSDAGVTWTAPALLNSNTESNSAYDWEPQVMTDAAGNWVAIWESTNSLGGTIGTDRDILVSRSADAGSTWTNPVPLNGNAASDSERDYSPQLAIDGAGNCVAVWESYDSLGGTIGTDCDILVTRSADAGVTWSAPTPLNSSAGSDSEHDLVPHVATDGAGSWVAAWTSRDSLDGMIYNDYDILVSRSDDAGGTWTSQTFLNTNASEDLGNDYVPRITTDRAGNWITVWSSTDSRHGTIGTDDDILFATLSETLWDYGDAPAPYPTLLADVGARHLATGPTLGPNHDAEPDGQPDPNALGDDNNGTPDDEDGVGFSPLVPGQTATMTVVVGGGGGVVEGWIDFNQDGIWQDPAERIFAGSLADGTQQLLLVVPPDAVPGTSFARVRISSAGGLAPTGPAADGEVEDHRLTIYPHVVARHVFYNNSLFDTDDALFNPGGNDNTAVATDKVPLMPGDLGASFANYTSFSKGINGLMIDVNGLPGVPSVADFAFHVGGIGLIDSSANNPSTWAVAPAPAAITVHPGEGTGGSHRIKLIWADNTIQRQWLQIRVKATTATGLLEDDVFYYGNAIGESGHDTQSAMVSTIDEIGARANQTPIFPPVPIDNRFDYDRNGVVSTIDEIIARANNTGLADMLLLNIVTTSPAPPALVEPPPILGSDETEHMTSIEDTIPADSVPPIELEAMLIADLDSTIVSPSEVQGKPHAKSHKTQIVNQETKGEFHRITARRFDIVHTNASQGAQYDKVTMGGALHDNRPDAADSRARFHAQKAQLEMLYDALAFDLIKVRASTSGNDTAKVTNPLDSVSRPAGTRGPQPSEWKGRPD